MTPEHELHTMHTLRVTPENAGAVCSAAGHEVPAGLYLHVDDLTAYLATLAAEALTRGEAVTLLALVELLESGVEL